MDAFELVDAAIRNLLEHDGRTVTGWALVAAVERVDPVDGVMHSLDYSTAPTTPTVLALGMADALAVELRRIVHGAFEGSE